VAPNQLAQRRAVSRPTPRRRAPLPLCSRRSRPASQKARTITEITAATARTTVICVLGCVARMNRITKSGGALALADGTDEGALVAMVEPLFGLGGGGIEFDQRREVLLHRFFVDATEEGQRALAFALL